MSEARIDNRLVEARKAIECGTSDEKDILLLLTPLVEDGDIRGHGRELCFLALNQDHSRHRIRLLLAKSFYLDEYAEFCVRELISLKFHVETPSLERLIEQTSESAPGYLRKYLNLERDGDDNEILVEDSVVAEVDLEADVIDMLDDLDT